MNVDWSVFLTNEEKRHRNSRNISLSLYVCRLTDLV